MVPELAGAAAAELADLRDGGVRRRRRAAGPVGGGRRRVAPTTSSAPTASARSPATASTCPSRCRPAAAGVSRDRLPLCALIAGWVRGQARPEARAEVRVYADDLDVDAAAGPRPDAARRDRRGQPTRSACWWSPTARNTLTPPAPGGYDPDSVPVQAALDDALAARRRRRTDPAARRRRRAGWPTRCWPGWPNRRRGRPASSTAARPTASATSSASGSPT